MQFEATLKLRGRIVSKDMEDFNKDTKIYVRVHILFSSLQYSLLQHT